MSDLLTAPIREKLWHKMRYDLANYVPEVAQNNLLMCCTCGRFLPQEFFDLEHLVPQQALKQDPVAVQINPATPKNVRAGNLLLCKKRLILNGRQVFNNGCNSWKGRHYDKPISELFSGEAFRSKGLVTNTHITAALAVAYLAMVAEFGYIIALMQSGLLMRQQFFNPRRFHRELPHRSQLLLGGAVPPPDAKIWAEPFSFSFDRPGACIVGARNFVVYVPVSRDPREPFARHLRIVPPRYKLRPDFKAFFD